MKNGVHKSAVYTKPDDERSVAMSILPKPDRAQRVRRMLMILLYIGYVGLWAIVLAVLQTYAMYLAAFSLVTLLILIFFTWRYVNPEYEIAIQRGQFTAAVIYGGLTRRELLSCRVKDLMRISPYETGAQKAEADGFAADRRLIFCADTGDREVWYVIHAPENGKKTVLIFDTEERLRKLLKYYGGSAMQD